MTMPLRILILEDNPADAELEVALLERAGYSCDWERVRDRDAFLARLRDGSYDLVFADHNLPSFDGFTALKLFRSAALGIPFIIISGTIGEEIAIDSLKAGATDYVMKTRLDRLVPVVERALHERAEHQQRRRAEEALRNSEEKFRSLFESSRDALMTLEPPSWRFTSGNPATVKMFRARNEEEFISHGPSELSPERQPDGRASAEKSMQMIETALRDGSHFFEWMHRRIGGEEFPADVLLTRIEQGGKVFLQATVRDITDRRRAEDQLVLQSSALASAANGIAITDRDGRIIWVNPSFIQLTGYTSDEVMGLTPRLLKSGMHNRAFYEHLWGTILSGQVWSGELVNRRKDGTLYTEELTITPVRQRGAITHFIAIQQDITERKKDEDARRRGDQRFRTLIEKSLDLAAIVDGDSTYRYANPAHEAIYGFKPEELIGTKAFDFLHPDDAQEIIPTLVEAVRAGVQASSIACRLRHKDGSWRAFEGVALNLFDDPEVAGILITGRDITERKRMEERTALRLQFAADISGTYDMDELLDRTHRRTAHALPCDGVVTVYWQPAEQVFRIIADYGLPPDYRAEARALQFAAGETFGDRLASGETVVINDFREATPLVAGIAERFGIAALVAAPLRVQGRNLGTLVAFRTAAAQPFERHDADLCTGIAAELVIAVEALNLQRQQREDAAVSDALARVGRELMSSLSTFTTLDHLCKITNEVLGCDCSYTVLRGPDKNSYTVAAMAGIDTAESEEARALTLPAEALTGLLAALSQQEVVQVEMTAPPTTWAVLPVRYGLTVVLYTPLRRDQEIIGVHAAGFRGRTRPFSHVQERIARGIGQLASAALENARLHEELESADRLKSDFVATMSHELRTPLNVIMGYNELLLDGLFGTLTAGQQDTLRRMDKSTRQLVELITATLDVGRLEAGKLPVEITEVDVADLIGTLRDETLDLQEESKLSFAWNVAPDLPLVNSDAVKLKVILKNLFSNAVKFTAVGSVMLDARPQGGGVGIAVTDTGIGISPEARAIIFESFRQADSSMTRSYGGLGLGLYIARRLAELLGGTVDVESEVGRGSTFRLWIPLRAAVGERVA